MEYTVRDYMWDWAVATWLVTRDWSWIVIFFVVVVAMRNVTQ